MEVRVAETAGFCFGVSRAVETVRRELAKNSGRKIYTYGPIVHNDLVVNELSSLGVGVIKGTEELEHMAEDGRLEGCVCIIRAHGISDSEMQLLGKIKGLSVIDATCPYVGKIHSIVKEHYAMGEKIIVTGDPSHHEVRGITGCIGDDAIVISEPLEAKKLRAEKGVRYCIVSQTTFNYRKFEDIVDIFKKKDV